MYMFTKTIFNHVCVPAMSHSHVPGRPPAPSPTRSLAKFWGVPFPQRNSQDPIQERTMSPCLVLQKENEKSALVSPKHCICLETNVMEDLQPSINNPTDTNDKRKKIKRGENSHNRHLQNLSSDKWRNARFLSLRRWPLPLPPLPFRPCPWEQSANGHSTMTKSTISFCPVFPEHRQEKESNWRSFELLSTSFHIGGAPPMSRNPSSTWPVRPWLQRWLLAEVVLPHHYRKDTFGYFFRTIWWVFVFLSMSQLFLCIL